MAVQYTTQTLAQVRRLIGQLVFGRDHFGYGTANAGSGTTITIPALADHVLDSFVGKTLYIISGTGNGQRRVISASTVSGVFTVSTSFTTTPDSTSVAEIWSQDVTPTQVNDIINEAIMDAGTVLNYAVSASSLTIDTNRTHITIPSTFTKVYELRFYDSSADEWTMIRPSRFPTRVDQENSLDYSFILVPGGKAFVYPSIPAGITAPNLYVYGYRPVANPSADTDVLECHPMYVVYRASALLEAGDAYGPLLDPEQHAGRAGNWLRLSDQYRNSMRTQWHPFTQEVVS